MNNLFQIEKYYMDSINDDGSVIIAYSADLFLFPVKVQFSNVLFIDKEKNIIQKRSFTNSKIPKFEKNLLHWESPKLKLEGSWYSITPPISDNLHTINTHELLWECLQPSAKSEINFLDQDFKGIGYTEKIRANIKPWDLGIKELKWGRFISDHISIVWIFWEGEHPKSNVYFNNQKFSDAKFNNNQIKFENYILNIYNLFPIRSGNVFKTILKGMPLISKLIPKNFQLDERKYLAEGEITINNINYKGWIIHEDVLW